MRTLLSLGSVVVVSGASLVTGTISPQVVQASAASRLGVYDGDAGGSAVAQFGSATGETIGYTASYVPWAAFSNPSWYINQWRGSGYRVVYSIPMLPPGGTLEEGAEGVFNPEFLMLSQQLVADGASNAILRIGWELTGNWYPWSAINDPVAYAAYWRQIVVTLRSVPGEQFQFDWNGGGGADFDVTQAYPGNSYVDYISADVYDQSWDAAAGYVADQPTVAGQEQAWSDIVNGGYGLNWMAAFAAANGKAIAFPEWGLDFRYDGHGGGDDPYFVEQMYSFMSSHDTAYEIYFDVDAGDGRHDLGDAAFAASYARFVSLFGGAAAMTKPLPIPVVTAGSETGYWVVDSGGDVHPFGDAGFFGSVGDVGLAAPVVGMASTPDGLGYWLVAADGGVFSFGDAGFFGSVAGIGVSGSVAVTRSSDGEGYLMLTRSGSVYGFGDGAIYGEPVGQLGWNGYAAAIAPSS